MVFGPSDLDVDIVHSITKSGEMLVANYGQNQGRASPQPVFELLLGPRGSCARPREQPLTPRRNGRWRSDFHQWQKLQKRHVAYVGKRELFGNQIGLTRKMLVEYREVLLNLRLCLGYRGSVPSFLGQEALGKNDSPGVAGKLQVTQLHVHVDQRTAARIGWRQRWGRPCRL